MRKAFDGLLSRLDAAKKRNSALDKKRAGHKEKREVKAKTRTKNPEHSKVVE